MYSGIENNNAIRHIAKTLPKYGIHGMCCTSLMEYASDEPVSLEEGSVISNMFDTV